MLRLSELRKSKKITQKKLAENLGVSVSCLSLWESGKREPSIEQLKLMAKIFNTNVGYLMGETDPPFPPDLLENIVELPQYLVPLVGKVVAGVPIESAEYIESYVAVRFKDVQNYFALRIHGESMKNARIYDGDIAIVKKQRNANDGDIIIALVDGEQTIKRFKKYGKTIFLMPENPDFSPIPITEETDFLILGKVVEIRVTL